MIKGCVRGRKGPTYMLYHELEYIGMRTYDAIKKEVKHILSQEASGRKDNPKASAYEHIRPESVGKIWTEDFTETQYYGSVGGKEFKNVFYNVWERRERNYTDKIIFLPPLILIRFQVETNYPWPSCQASQSFMISTQLR